MGEIILTTTNSPNPDSLVLHPHWNITEERTAQAHNHRALNGILFTYRWSAYSKFRIPLHFSDEAERALLHDWWLGETDLFFTMDTSAENSTTICRITNITEPLGRRVPGLLASWAGLLLLEAIDHRKNI